MNQPRYPLITLTAGRPAAGIEYAGLMVTMTVLASGSRGNSTVVASSRTRILVDAGLSCRELFKRMQQAGQDPCALDAILITHEHQDHVQGLSVAARKLGIAVYFTEATHRAWLRWMNPRKRMTYADWLRQRQQEAAARKIEAGAAGASYALAAAGALPEPRGAARTEGLPIEDDPFYREQELAECAAEEAELAGPLAAAANDARTIAAPGSRSETARRLTQPGSAEKSPNEATTRALTGSTTAAATGLRTAARTAPTAALRTAPRTEAEAAPDGDCPEASLSLEMPEPDRPAADPCALPGVEYFRAGACFSIGDIEIVPFTIPHDAADPVGFVFKAEGIKIGMATDLGYMPANVAHNLRSCDIVMLESNHDLDMLRDGPYPWSVKQRVMSRVGHLSNAAAAEFLERGYDGQAAYVVLAHLSESNNMPELARVAAEFALRNRMNLLANKLVLAGQHTPTEPLCL